MSPLSREDLYPHHVYVSNITPEGKGVGYSHTAFDGSHMFLPVMFDWRNKKQQQDRNWHPNQASDRNILESAKAPGTISPWPYDYVQWTYFGDSEDPSQDIDFYNARHDFKNPDTLRVQVVRNPFERMLSVYLHVCKYLETPTYGAIQQQLSKRLDRDVKETGISFAEFVDYLETVKNGFEHDWGDENIRYSFDHPYCSQAYKPQALPLPGGTAPQCVRLANISSASDVPSENGVVVLRHNRLFSELEQLATTFKLPPFSRQELEEFFISNHDVLTDKSINVAAGSLAAINHRPAKPDPILVVPSMEAFYTPELQVKIAAIYKADFERGGFESTKLPNMAESEPYQLMQRLAAVVGENHPLTGAVLRAVHEQQYEQAIIESIAGRASQTN